MLFNWQQLLIRFERCWNFIDLNSADTGGIKIEPTDDSIEIFTVACEHGGNQTRGSIKDIEYVGVKQEYFTDTEIHKPQMKVKQEHLQGLCSSRVSEQVLCLEIKQEEVEIKNEHYGDGDTVEEISDVDQNAQGTLKTLIFQSQCGIQSNYLI